jgi:hypothetical protein
MTAVRVETTSSSLIRPLDSSTSSSPTRTTIAITHRLLVSLSISPLDHILTTSRSTEHIFFQTNASIDPSHQHPLRLSHPIHSSRNQIRHSNIHGSVRHYVLHLSRLDRPTIDVRIVPISPPVPLHFLLPLVPRFLRLNLHLVVRPGPSRRIPRLVSPSVQAFRRPRSPQCGIEASGERREEARERSEGKEEEEDAG